MSVFDLRNETDVFISTQNLTGNNNGWFREILENASYAPVIIPCLTKESIKSPWLHFETGIGTCRKLYPTRVIPFLFKIRIDDLGANMGMYQFHQMVHCDDHDNIDIYNESLSKVDYEDVYYETLLCRLIYYVSAFLRENRTYMDELVGIYYNCRIYDTYNQGLIKSDYNSAIKKAVDSLKRISELYKFRDFYLSRPMQGVSKSLSEDYEKVLNEMTSIAQNYSYKVFYGSKSSVEKEPGLSDIRLGILKEAQMFVMIYPKITGRNIVPSSCLIELGAALAYEKTILMFIQNGAKLPTFIRDLKKMGILCYSYKEPNEVKAQWDKFLSGLNNE